MWWTPRAVDVGRCAFGLRYAFRISAALASKSVCWAVIVGLHAQDVGSGLVAAGRPQRSALSVPRLTYQSSVVRGLKSTSTMVGRYATGAGHPSGPPSHLADHFELLEQGVGWQRADGARW